MTIHKSKGLEFPICYFAGFSSKFNLMDLKEKIIFDNRYGFILPKVDGYYKDTILKTLLKYNTKLEEISEKIRLLYVAVTRAKEKMIIVMPEQEEEREVLDIVPSYVREKYNSFLSIMQSIYSSLLPYIVKSDVEATKDYLNNSKTLSNDLVLDNDFLDVNEISIDTSIIIKVHEILEEVDFNNTSSLDLVDQRIKNKILAFINSDLMKDKLNLNMYKEYEFIDNTGESTLHGIIDLLIEGEDMTIIDYKLKNIDDSAYDKQLNGYRRFIEKKTGKKTRCFLYSILDEVYREVLND